MTSVLDNVTEVRVIDELKRRAHEGEKMVLMVLHRISTLRRADLIIVMDEEPIVWDDIFEELEGCEVLFRDFFEVRATAPEVLESN